LLCLVTWQMSDSAPRPSIIVPRGKMKGTVASSVSANSSHETSWFGQLSHFQGKRFQHIIFKLFFADSSHYLSDEASLILLSAFWKQFTPTVHKWIENGNDYIAKMIFIKNGWFDRVCRHGANVLGRAFTTKMQTKVYLPSGPT
jgi:hypothetical protein